MTPRIARRRGDKWSAILTECGCGACLCPSSRIEYDSLTELCSAHSVRVSAVVAEAAGQVAHLTPAGGELLVPASVRVVDVASAPIDGTDIDWRYSNARD